MANLEPLLNWMSWICSVSFCPEVSSWSGSQVFTRTVMGPPWPPYRVSLNTARPPSYTLAWSVAMVIVGVLVAWALAGEPWKEPAAVARPRTAATTKKKRPNFL